MPVSVIPACLAVGMTAEEIAAKFPQSPPRACRRPLPTAG